MKYDFTTILERTGKDSLAADRIPFENLSVEEGYTAIPMWVADMSFPTAPFIVDAMQKRLEMPNFGYFQPSEAYFDSIIRWHRERKVVTDLQKENIGYENGVLGGISSAVRAFSAPGESILVHSPTYVGFTGVLKGLGRKIVHSKLEMDEHGIWRMNFEDMDRKIRENHIHLVIFCSPHNPCGRVWEREELERMMRLFRKHDVYVVSDEIWSDLTLKDYRHIPTQSVSEDARMRTIALYAPSKTFNLAGLVGSYHIIYNPTLRDRVAKEASLSHYNSMNVLSMYALIGAYREEGYEWLAELKQVLSENVDFACAYIGEHFDGVRVTRPQGTYMLFMDCTEWCEKHHRDLDWVEHAGWDVGVDWQDGRRFHGPCHIRLNLALPLSRVREAFDRMDRYVFNARIDDQARLEGTR